MKLSLIAVIGRNRELGKENKLILEVPGDLPRFKKITMGHPVIMGRKTYESIPTRFRPLAGRTNIVITSNKEYKGEGVVIVDSVEKAIETAKKSPGGEELFVIGGGQVFAQTIDRADRLYLTVVDAAPEADTFFPEYSEFKKMVSEENYETEEGLRYKFVILER